MSERVINVTNAKQKLLAVIGPTAVGKTAMSIALAKRMDGEIISGDSMQVYKGMDIGTAKIKKTEMDGIPHYMLDIKDPSEDFSAAEFQELARGCIQEISAKGKLPIIAGGTGLYIQSVLYDYEFTETASDEVFRRQKEEDLQRFGEAFLHEELTLKDPVSAARIHPNNVRRVIRALEIFHCTGSTMTEFLEKQKKVLQYDAALIGLTADRELLYERINKRVDHMMEEGLLDEVSRLYESGLKGVQSIQAIGYKELYRYLDGTVPLQEAVQELKQNSRRYAKRQLTWFRNKMDVEWFDMTPPVNTAEKEAEIFTYAAGKLKL
ncbi:tRNA (adenosine(37)-N6)-dimethylallyltransferase MiaA [Metabacillus sp. GX 13764]|uniref:tRNA (adenosine(37)-N6)-dimethylallyltransferase MiaA n=1 Tax=Metabacillus kandeliae TaxID=2900151 RepID=UPI001E41F669|nr:tRNA (adenosine(37)-N6)-dimethylallyltransferase MiaA [Metabacillus kandeliae]MCD7033688.1 tRNA (adenosine(37)-N6)-dimethylallyltransferase MiaA [Metabacillus kandeliae]